jgi:hypothetical protein
MLTAFKTYPENFKSGTPHRMDMRPDPIASNETGKMNSVLCTIFESHYYYGVAALTNSLYLQGYRGEIFAGYRGELPKKFPETKINTTLQWPGARTLEVGKDLALHFLPIETEYHLTNYKPDFMLRLWDGPAKNSQRMFYFDPDIILSVPWSFIESWSDFGVALCEDVNSPLSEFHPRRMAWRKYFGGLGFLLQYKDPIYSNGGFVGLTESNREFLELWKQLQEAIAPVIGGLNRSSFSGEGQLSGSQSHDYAPFSRTDQDALNAAVEAWRGSVSLVGKAGMAFGQGTPLMPHAIGAPKPWHWKPILQALKGFPSRKADLAYWNSVKGPLIMHKTSIVYWRLLSLKIAGFISRFYRKG